MKNKILAILSIIAFCISLSACNTLHGLGKDIRIAGEQLENATGPD